MSRFGEMKPFSRLHPLDVLRIAFAGAAAVVTLIALFQEANIRFRFPVIRRP